MTELTVTVRTDLLASQYRALDALATASGTTVGSLVRECVRRQLAGRPEARVKKEPNKRVREQHLESIREMHARGMSDAAIGRELGIAHSTVSLRRDAMGLPALFPGRPKKTREEVAS